jgi:uncharacterized protein
LRFPALLTERGGHTHIPVALADLVVLAVVMSALPAGAGAQTVTPVHAIQGGGNSSPLVGQTVTTRGIVTGVRSAGFFIQAPENEADGDPATSEGVYVYTSKTPPAAAMPGNLVLVTGKISEYVPSADPGSPSLTELSGTIIVSQLSSGNPLPAPVVLTAQDTDPGGSMSDLGRYQGMRVRIDSATVVAPTAGRLDEKSATSTSTGVFFVVLEGLARPFREPGVSALSQLPAGSPCCVPRFDDNPERMRVDSASLVGSQPVDVAVGASVRGLVGPLDIAAATWTVLTDPSSPPVATGGRTVEPLPAAADDEVTVATLNLERFFDTADDPTVADAVLTAAAFELRVRKAALAIATVLASPDILAVEEVENLATLQTIGDASSQAAGKGVVYTAFLEPGNDVGGINVGFLVNTARVTVDEAVQLHKGLITPVDGYPLHDRPPLLLRATVRARRGLPLRLTLIANHLRSLIDIEDTTKGPRVRAKRLAQAEDVARIVQERQLADPAEGIVVLGDLNAFEFSDGLVDVVGTLRGTPAPPDSVVLAGADLVDPDLVDLVTWVPAAERYSFVETGNAQVLDHMLANARAAALVRTVRFARFDADFPDILRNSAERPERVSDHDALLATLVAPSAVHRRLRAAP